LGTLDSTVYDLKIFNGKLVASGSFVTSGGGHIAWWDSTTTTWRPMSDIVTDIGDENIGNLPTEFILNQNYPNPFNPSTTISFQLDKKMHVSLEVFNINGQVVKTVVDKIMSAGTHQYEWDATSSSGEKVATGLYYYKLTTDNSSHTKKMLLLK